MKKQIAASGTNPKPGSDMGLPAESPPVLLRERFVLGLTHTQRAGRKVGELGTTRPSNLTELGWGV